MIAEKSDAVDTCTVYDAAPDDAFQLSVGVMLTPVAASAGEISVGDEGAETIVVKLRELE